MEKTNVNPLKQITTIENAPLKFVVAEYLAVALAGVLASIVLKKAMKMDTVRFNYDDRIVDTQESPEAPE